MDGVVEIVEHVISHSIADTLYLIPFLFATYVAMEFLEHKTGTRTQNAIRRAGSAGPFIGALLGVVPQCGFSAAGATLYAGRVISIGTLMAIFLSTSDEMLPIFFAEKVEISSILIIMGVKVVVAMLVGFLVDTTIRIARRESRTYKIHELCADADCGCTRDCETCEEYPELVYEHCQDCPPGCNHEYHEHDHTHDHDHGWLQIFKSAAIHTGKILLFLFVITLVLNTILETVGEEALESILGGDSMFSIIISALVGLIPNCAASLLIAQLYVEGIMGTAAMFSGLLVSAGIGLLVLIRTNHPWQQNAAIIFGLFAVGVLVGIICSALGITIVP